MKPWKSKLLLAVAFPALLLVATEVVLRWSGAGFPDSFLVEAEVDGEPVWVENPFFTYHIFSPPLARIPAPLVVKQKKPDGAFRVVVLGESAAQGDPIPDFGPARVLEYALRHRAPTARVEVINAAITAINSHVIREIARDLPKLQPDVVILYIGNNEVIGPYGPGTVFAGYVENDALIRFALWLGRSKISQVMRYAIAAVSDRDAAEEFHGVAMFMDKPVRHDDPRLAAVRRRYEQNLRAIIRDARAAGATVVLSTVAVNKSDCPPSISVHRAGMSETDLSAWRRAFDAGVAAADAGDDASAIGHFRAAEMLDHEHAETLYREGVCLARSGQRKDAGDVFTRALDLDAFRYRTDSPMNELIRRLAVEEGGGVTLCDAAVAFDGRADETLFLDHVHFSFDGASLLANLWMESILGIQTWPQLPATGTGPDVTWLRNELLYTHAAEISTVQEMARRYSKPPFDRMFDHTGRMARLNRRIDECNAALRAATDGAITDALRDRIRRYPDDLYFPSQLAQALFTANRFREARDVAESSLRRYPHRRGPRSMVALLYAREGRAAEAADIMVGFQRKHGYFAVMGSTYLFNTLLPAGYASESAAVGRAISGAVRQLDYRWRIEAETKEVEGIATRYAEALWQIETGNYPEAEKHLVSLLGDRPDLGDAIFWLAVVRAKLYGREASEPVLQQALASMSFARGFYHAGLWQVKSGSVTSAADLLAESALRANDDLELVNSIAWILATDRREGLHDPKRARTLLEDALDSAPMPPANILDTLAVACAEDGDLEAALSLSTRASDAARAAGNKPLLNEIAIRRKAIEAGKPATWGRFNRPLNWF